METLQRTANRGSISTGYDIDNSLKLEADNTEYLYKTNDTGTNRKTFTVSMWFKRTELTNDYMILWLGADVAGATRLGFYGASGAKETLWVDLDGSGTYKRSYSTQVLRDTSAWYHVVLAVDTTQAVEANRMLVWLNGVNLTSWGQQQIPAQNFETSLGASGSVMKWGAYDNTYYKMCGYIAECHYLDGVTAQNSDFGEFDEDTGIWKPIKYTGTYGGNGCYLKFDDSSNLGADSSGNSNNFTLNNITSADQATDTPTNNFCTLNPLSPSVPTYNTLTEGGTQMNSLGNAWTTVWSSVPLFKGKWYAEFKRTATNNVFIGAGGIDSNLYYFNLNYVGNNGNGTTFSVGLYSINGDFYSGSGTTGSSYATGDIICLAVDQDNGAIYFRKNNDAWMGDGTNAGNPASGSSRTGAQIIDWGTATVLATSIYSSGDTVQANFGGYTSFSNSTSYSDELGMGSFVYEPPASYLAICTKNLAEYG